MPLWALVYFGVLHLFGIFMAKLLRLCLMVNASEQNFPFDFAFITLPSELFRPRSLHMHNKAQTLKGVMDTKTIRFFVHHALTEFQRVLAALHANSFPAGFY